ncbi:glycosyltransferase family 2 protein [Dactylosporangium roseum]|uniref:Glycosyltransferase family 2 protein n=1 Tax=Dactylosporangium roseum TaxID=47989 RepID=A0ABY5YZ09_9ACTN|nr:glycosyltransferase family 2 protein [Dactylosporangium roseum]UWZ34757.1 glycosyltransferase family 2 protein [Dactylosporangium roseum]
MSDGAPDGGPPKVATVTVGTNELKWLDRCLGSLTKSDTTGFELECHYVDNASADGSADHVAAAYPSVCITRNERNLGFTGANNVGIRKALDGGADYVFLINPDTFTPPGLVRGLVEFAERWPDYGVIGPMQYRYNPDSDELADFNDWSQTALWLGEQHAFAGDGIVHPSPAGPMTGRAPRTFEPAYVQGAAFFVRAEVFAKIGLLDPVFHTYYEETDLCRRVRWAGWRVALLLDLGVQHYGGGGTAASEYTRVNMRRNRYYYLLTDVEWSPLKTARLVSRWLVDDLRGHSVSGDTAPAIGRRETAQALVWIARRLPTIRSRRAEHRRLAGARAR